MGTIKLNSVKSSSRSINYAEKRAVVKSALNCEVNYAKTQFKQIRMLFKKDNGVQAHTVIQSFAPGEVTPEKANQLGLELAQSIAKNHQVVVYTHADTEHIHNHIIINSVNKENGKKFVNQRKTIYETREANDEICKNHGLSVIEEKTGKVRYKLAEQAILEKSQISWKEEIREAVENSLNSKNVSSLADLYNELAEKYQINLNLRGETITYESTFKGTSKKVRAGKLGHLYTKEGIVNELERQAEEQRKQQQLAKLNSIKPVTIEVAANDDRDGHDFYDDGSAIIKSTNRTNSISEPKSTEDYAVSQSTSNATKTDDATNIAIANAINDIQKRKSEKEREREQHERIESVRTETQYVEQSDAREQNSQDSEWNDGFEL